MEVRQTRHQEIRLIKYDQPAANIRYTGRSDSMRASDSDEVWQILLEYRVGDVTTSTYALMGSFKARWDQRTTYFSSTTANNDEPLGPIGESVKTAGLSGGGKVTVVTLNSSTWTALPSSSRSGRDAFAVQNENASVKVKLNYDSATSGFVGMTVYPNGGERQYNITAGTTMYAKCESGSITVNVEELS